METPGAYPRRKHLKSALISWVWHCPQILRPDWKGFPRTNALAYLASSFARKEKGFITLMPGEGDVVATGGVKIVNNVGTVESGHLVASAVDNVDVVV